MKRRLFLGCSVSAQFGGLSLRCEYVGLKNLKRAITIAISTFNSELFAEFAEKISKLKTI